jgi:hypothetical protein
VSGRGLLVRWRDSILLKLYDRLTRNDPVQPSDLIYVMAGRHDRKVYGLELFRAGVAPRLLLSVGRYEVSRFPTLRIPGTEELLAMRDATPPEQRHFFVELSAGGVRIERAGLAQWSTSGEVAALRRFLTGHSLRRLVVVSTDVHLRRVAFTFGRAFGRTAVEFLYCPVPSRQQVLQREQWWTRPKDRRFVLSESVKLAGYHVLRR